MKKGGILILTALLMLAAGCGGQRDGEGGAEEAEVSLAPSMPGWRRRAAGRRTI